MTVATLESVKTFAYIPARGQRFLSVNLALVDLSQLSDIAKALGFKPELVQMQGKSGTQVHALLWQGSIEDTPADLDARVEVLADQVNTEAIRYATGAWTNR
ncbi:MAG: hypothetical protein KME27_10815 [Lyngbya sp. HA4199-MV5]|jgi:hypothetical protein|nr:hypothetical protein [Lyngbya sp. HA4199-MV5]